LLKDLWGTGLSWIDMVKIGWIEKKVSIYLCAVSIEKGIQHAEKVASTNYSPVGYSA